MSEQFDDTAQIFNERKKIRARFPNLKAGDMTNEAFERHCNNLGGEPSVERLSLFVDAFDDTARSKYEIGEAFNWNRFQVDAFCFFAEAAGLLEPYGRKYRPSFEGSNFFTQNPDTASFAGNPAKNTDLPDEGVL